MLTRQTSLALTSLTPSRPCPKSLLVLPPLPSRSSVCFSLSLVSSAPSPPRSRPPTSRPSRRPRRLSSLWLLRERRRRRRWRLLVSRSQRRGPRVPSRTKRGRHSRIDMKSEKQAQLAPKADSEAISYIPHQMHMSVKARSENSPRSAVDEKRVHRRVDRVNNRLTRRITRYLRVDLLLRRSISFNALTAIRALSVPLGRQLGRFQTAGRFIQLVCPYL